MAFNPFESFRKNSKAMLAVLTIFIMFVFILSSGIGGGDFFDWMARQFGGSDRRGPVYGEIAGTEYHSQELDEVRQQRAAANLFMLTAIERADQLLISQIEQDLKNNLIRKQDIQPLLARVKNEREEVIQFGRILRMSAEQVAGQFASLSATMYARANDPQLNEREHAAEIRNLRRAGKVFDHSSTIVGFGGNGLYFGEIPNANGQDALAFLMVLKEADRLDLKYTDDDVKKLITEETEGVLNDDKTAQEVDAAVRRNYKVSSDQILKGIVNEYRMRTALTIMRGRQTFPAAQTPHDMFVYYKDRCTPIRFEPFDLAVEKYIPLVQGEPTEKEMRELYDTYARQEYDPARATPGFKEPRKIKIEYVGLDDSLPAYKQARPIMQAATTSTFPIQSLSGGNAFTGALFAVAPLLAEPLLVRDSMEQDPVISAFRQQELVNRVQHGFPEVPRILGLNLVDEVLTLIRMNDFVRSNRFVEPFPIPGDLLLYQPLPLASLTAQLALASNPMAAAGSAVTAMRNTTRLLDVRARVAAGMQVAVAPLASNPAFPFTSSVAALANLPTLPEGFWIATYLERQRETKMMERRFAKRDFDRLQERLNEIRKRLAPPEEKTDDLAAPPKKKDAFKPKPEDVKKANDDARALIDQFIKERTAKDRPSVRTGKSEKARDQFDMQNDPGLKTLTELYFDPKPYARYQSAFFGAFDPKEDLSIKLYTPVVFPDARVDEMSFRGPTYLAWRIEDNHPKQVPYSEVTPEMKAQIVRAWKIRKARDLANEDAQKLATTLETLGQKNLIESDNLPALEREFDTLTRQNDKWTRLSPIELAFLNEHPPMQANTRPSFMLPAIRNPGIPYPLSTPPDREDMFAPTQRDPWNGRQMAFQLLEARSKPLGTTVIVSDTPQMHVYVNVMVKKTPPSVAAFYQVYRLMQAPNARSQNPLETPKDYFYGPFRMEGRVNQDRDMFARIKADVKFKETEELKKSLEKRGAE